MLLTNRTRGLESLDYALLAKMPAPARTAQAEDVADYPGNYPLTPAEATLTPDELREYAGLYRLGSVTFTVTEEGGRLWVQLTGQGRAQVFASAMDEFFYKVVNAQLSFVRDGAGKVVALVLHQLGRDQRAERLKE